MKKKNRKFELQARNLVEALDNLENIDIPHDIPTREAAEDLVHMYLEGVYKQGMED